MLLTKIHPAHRASLELGEGQIVQSNLSSVPEIGSVPGKGGGGRPRRDADADSCPYLHLLPTE